MPQYMCVYTPREWICLLVKPIDGGRYRPNYWTYSFKGVSNHPDQRIYLCPDHGESKQMKLWVISAKSRRFCPVTAVDIFVRFYNMKSPIFLQEWNPDY